VLWGCRYSFWGNHGNDEQVKVGYPQPTAFSFFFCFTHFSSIFHLGCVHAADVVASLCRFNRLGF
jgi:hypothetical protein